MSATRQPDNLMIADRPWEDVLAQLRAEGFSPVESIKVTRAVLRVSLGDAKAIVHDSVAWADLRPGFDTLHDIAETAARGL